jgi:hypothetical protein
MTRDEMDRATQGITTKSAKIRVLDKLGATRSEIATYLQIRYQHVRNVLVSPAPASQNGGNREYRSIASNADEAVAGFLPLSIDEAKRGLAARFGVSPSAIEIMIKG